MPKTFLLLRESLSSTSLTTVVAKSQYLRPPFPEYNLSINSSQLEISLLQKPLFVKPIQHDEGFESDVDSISLISSDDSFTSSTCLVEDHVLKHRENDSANGSSSSESDTEATVASKTIGRMVQSYQLSDVLCYTDVQYPQVLIFVILDEVLVFNFDDLNVLQSFYTSFNTLKAVTNQRTYNTINTKFNLLSRTDNNGVTHIEISREPPTKILLPETVESSSIISLNTPEVKTVKANNTIGFLDDSRVVLQSELRSSRSEFYPQSINSYTLRPKSTVPSSDGENTKDTSLKKIWKSAEDLLDAPKRPERRRKPKGRAPLPPVGLNQPNQQQINQIQRPNHQNQRKDLSNQQHNIMKGQFIRVAVDPKKTEPKVIHNDPKVNFQTFSSNVQTFTPNWNNLRTPQSPLILTTIKANKQNKLPEMKPKSEQNWTNSVPRLLRKPRSKSETRSATPMAYRYIDTTKPQYTSSSQTISNRLFGLSQKLKEFGSSVTNKSYFYDGTTETRRNSLGEMTYKGGTTESNLKSVIKKQDDKKNKSGEKKVTFSAYATVQVV